MGVVTKYFCDKCEVEQTKNELWEICVAFRSNDWHQHHVEQSIKPKALWCRECCQEFSDLLPTPKAVTPIVPQKDLTELIREMIREEAYEAAAEALNNQR